MNPAATRFAAFVALTSLAQFAAATESADVAGAQDHPMFERYEGSTIVGYETETYTDYGLLIAPAKLSGGLSKNPDSVQTIEGKYTAITYRSPENRSTFEVFRNYETALQEAGFDVLFSCKDAECGGRSFSHAVVERARNYSRMGESKEFRYLAGRLARGGGDVHVGLYVALAGVGGGPDYKRAMVQLEVVESQSMDAEMVLVNADAMSESISATGRVALYGIYFDTDKATLKSESQPTLEQVASLLTRDPRMKIVIVGHTDAVGSFDHNMDLSTRRAEAVRDALVSDHGIEGARLRAWGVGYLSPVASNQDDAGRARNRRVELVKE